MKNYKDSKDITLRLHRWSTGNRDAENELFEAVLPDLRRLAQYLMKGERYCYSLEPAELVNQIYFRLAAAKKQTWQNRQHFFAFATRAMRQYLIDYARASSVKKFVSIEADGEHIASVSPDLDLLIFVGCLLDQLRATNQNWWRLVELRCVRGLTEKEAAEAMRMRLRTMQRMSADVRLWLSERAGSELIIRRRRRGNTTRPSGRVLRRRLPEN